MELKSVTIDDKPILAPFLSSNKYGICDFSFSNLFIWRHCYQASYCIHKNHLIVLSSTFDGVPHFFMPLSTDGGDIKPVIDDMIEYSAKHFGEFRMLALTPEMIDELRAFMPPEFMIKEADVWDYIYSSEALITLRGKKLHQKRNHINKFDSLYAYEYIDLKQEHIPLCQELLDTWLAENDAGDPSIDAEKTAVSQALEHFEEIGLIGGGLVVDGRLAAFTLGQPLNDKIFVINIEKALYEYNGIYAKINQQFAERNCKDFVYINREEDMGIEGLRKAKMSYHPDLMLYKHAGIMKI